MGRQFQIYLLPSDAVRLIEVLRSEIGLNLLASRSPTPMPAKVVLPTQIHAGFTRVDCLLVPDDSASLRTEFLEKQNQWIINTLFSEVIEVRGCHFDEKTLKRGRFFYDTRFYQSQLRQEKSPIFLRWAEHIFKTAKKFLTRVSDLEAYVGPDAERWRSAGGAFVALSIKNSSSSPNQPKQ
jgi:hypothetical protein